ncbi:type VII toxin-antitoxin system MntA family adenylyltransferase antitoxin [Petroclostridium xylanilyticum]|jgi:predicted nucleotidyltransferase|uniref:type VII toxin-antitoxin system MntA family adenylyltransferase antitoxin n=1 Tax=Petroclostridium xylanilyticum TaxID=1792311 RepID=UPI000B99BDF9|nr:nucleotidyltransferase domain-containing protein [Petroclostridium xylanilyticum]
MKNRSLESTDIEKINDLLKDKLSPDFTILFGSAAKGKLRDDSDVDIAFMSNCSCDEYHVFMIAQELADTLGREVDLIDLNKASTVFKAQIVANGKVIYDKEPYKRMIFQMKALKEYALLNEERQCVIDRIKGRGVDYAN